MIEFKTNYTPGPWISYERDEPVGYAKYEIHFSSDGECVSEVVHAKEDSLLISIAPKMAEYMMDLAKAFHDMLLWQPNWDGKPEPWQKFELDKILSILKDAGIEVVEK